jgi:hypothetical protein
VKAPAVPDQRTHEGGCFCGAIRYAFSGVADAGYCHCSICRRSSGAPVLAWVNTPRSGFRVLRGAPRFAVTSAEFRRAFCADCGTMLWSESTDPARWDMVSVHHGTIDGAAAIEPLVHICHADRLPWFHIDDDLPRFDGSVVPPPGARDDGGRQR